jgi:hypothetical protein
VTRGALVDHGRGVPSIVPQCSASAPPKHPDSASLNRRVADAQNDGISSVAWARILDDLPGVDGTLPRFKPDPHSGQLAITDIVETRLGPNERAVTPILRCQRADPKPSDLLGMTPHHCP